MSQETMSKISTLNICSSKIDEHDLKEYLRSLCPDDIINFNIDMMPNIDDTKFLGKTLPKIKKPTII